MAVGGQVGDPEKLGRRRNGASSLFWPYPAESYSVDCAQKDTLEFFLED